MVFPRMIFINKQTLNNFCILTKCMSSVSVMMVKYFQVDLVIELFLSWSKNDKLGSISLYLVIIYLRLANYKP